MQLVIILYTSYSSLVFSLFVAFFVSGFIFISVGVSQSSALKPGKDVPPSVCISGSLYFLLTNFFSSFCLSSLCLVCSSHTYFSLPYLSLLLALAFAPILFFPLTQIEHKMRINIQYRPTLRSMFSR